MSDVDAILRKSGLDAKEPPEPMRYPRVVDECDGKLWIRCLVDGVDREVDLTTGQAEGMVLTLLAWLFKRSR